MRIRRAGSVALALLATLLPTTRAAAQAPRDKSQPFPAVAGSWVISQGIEGALRHRDTSFDVRLEWRAARGLGAFRPWAGLEGTTLGAGFAGGGVLVDVPLPMNLHLTPSFGLGAYRNGREKDLGFPVQFRSQIEVSWAGSAGRIGLALSHSSNGGLGDRNPGTEVISVVFVLPGGAQGRAAT